MTRELCFVIGPIGKDRTPERKHADLILYTVIKHTLEQAEFCYQVRRADGDANPGMINDRVINDILSAELVVADLTDLNPNAFYELGIRHAAVKPTIHIARTDTDLPFDNFQHRTIFVDLTDWQSTEQARALLADAVRAIRAVGYRVSNPVTQANASFKMRQSDDPRDQMVADVRDQLSTLGMPPRYRMPYEQHQQQSKVRDLINLFRGSIGALRQTETSHEDIQKHLRNLASERGIVLIKLEIDDNDIAFETSTGGVARFTLDGTRETWSSSI